LLGKPYYTWLPHQLGSKTNFRGIAGRVIPHPGMLKNEPSTPPAADGERLWGVGDFARLLLDPAKAKGMAANSTARRLLEAASLALNLAAFYLIVMLNKKLLKEPAKGGYVRDPAHFPKGSTTFLSFLCRDPNYYCDGCCMTQEIMFWLSS
jgi:hypothetical protein